MIIKTNIKFSKGLNGNAEKLYGFVTKINGSWRGCRAETVTKKIVLVDDKVAQSIEPNVLYHCHLKPMKNDKGFIVTSAKLLKFPARILVNENNTVSVLFGNKEVIYNPADTNKMYNNIQNIANMLRNRVDLEKANDVAEDFIGIACMAKRIQGTIQ